MIDFTEDEARYVASMWIERGWFPDREIHESRISSRSNMGLSFWRIITIEDQSWLEDQARSRHALQTAPSLRGGHISCLPKPPVASYSG